MPGTNPNEIRVAGSGRILIAPLGTTAPTDVATAWGAGWKDLGYTTTDGVKFTKKDKIETVRTWQSDAAARLVYSDRDLTLKFALLQFNEDTLPLFFGGGTVSETVTGSKVYKYDVANSPANDERMLGVEFADGGTIKYRFVIPRGQVTDTEELALTRTAAAKLGMTFTALAKDDSSPLASWIMNDPAYVTP